MAFVTQTKTTENIPASNQHYDSSILLATLLLIAGAKASKKQLRKLKRKLLFNAVKYKLKHFSKKGKLNFLQIFLGLIVLGLLVFLIIAGAIWWVVGITVFCLLFVLAAYNAD